MSRTVLITGAGGNIGTKLRAHFQASAGRCGCWTSMCVAIRQSSRSIWPNGMTHGWRSSQASTPRSILRASEPASVLGFSTAPEHRPDCQCL